MANPSEAEIQTMLKNAAAALENLRAYGEDYLDDEDALQQSLEGSHAAAGIPALRTNVRQRVAAALADSSAAAVLRPYLREYGRLIDSTATSDEGILEDLYRHFIEESESVQSRGMTLGNPTAGSNEGTGLIRRLKVDAEGLDIEGQWPTAKQALCVRDGRSGAASKGGEVFAFTDQAAEIDRLSIRGEGLRQEIAGVLSEGGVLQNASFSQATLSGGDLIALPGWAVVDIDEVELVTTTPYRPGGPADLNPQALRFKTNNKLTQDLEARRTVFNPATPWYFQIAVRREASCDGTLTVRFGDVSRAVVMTTLTNDQWALLTVDIGDDCWFKNFNKAGLTFEIELSGRTTGTVRVDDVILRPWTNFAGDWYIVVGGATPFEFNDIFEWTDSEHASEGVIQRWLWRAYRRYLPHSSSPTIADP